MADIVGAVGGVAQTLLSAVESSLTKNIYAVINYKSDIEDLKKIIETVASILHDAGNKNTDLNANELDLIQKLKDVVYDADDLFDEFLTRVELKQNDDLLEKVRKFFSSNNWIKGARSMVNDVEKIRVKLNDIRDGRAILGLSVNNNNPRNMINRETHSFVRLEDVVGREEEATQVITKLLEPAKDNSFFTIVGVGTQVITKLLEPAKDVSFFTIVGIGGVGKTTLAKLVFRDQRIQSEFSLKLWVSVSNQDREPLDIQGILVKILESANCKLNMTSYENVQAAIANLLRDTKFLLVLDDVWNENKLEWDELSNFLRTGRKGSRIVVTTRSNVTANNIGPDRHELEGLSKKNSWRLFEMTAFAKGSKPSREFVEISVKIVEKCCNVPLALKVVGSLLCGKPIDKWQLFEEIGLAEVSNGTNEMMSILRFSYDHLEPSLKSCFAYCGLFPKGYVINKEMLVHLWEAQGYLVPFDEGQSIQKTGTEYVEVMLQRCFFQDVNKNEFGDVVSFKMHDLMHDLSQIVSKHECLVITDSTESDDVKNTIRHQFDARHTYKFSDGYFNDNKIRSYLMFGQHEKCVASKFLVGEITKKLVRLRALALALNSLDNEELPDTFNSLLHLRYLNIVNPCISKLPRSITKLHNLQTLNLSNCKLLREWPRDFCNLVNLMYLYIDQCGQLKCMPDGMRKLSRLCVLTDFFVRDQHASSKQIADQLNDLKALADQFKGHIVFHLAVTVEVMEWKERCLEGSEHLKKVKIIFSPDAQNQEEAEKMLRKLQPHHKLERFELDSYRGNQINRWGKWVSNWVTILPNLVSIKLSNCTQLLRLPDLSELSSLKSLHLNELTGLYMVTKRGRVEGAFFPSLESLEIHGCSNAEKLWDESCAFPRLSQLSIIKCRRLREFPCCPTLQKLKLRENQSSLRIRAGEVYISPSSSSANKLSLFAEVDHVYSLDEITPQCLTDLNITNEGANMAFKKVEDVFKICSSSLLSLQIRFNGDLKNMFIGLKHLKALSSLTLEGCKELTFEESEHTNPNGMPWKSLCNSLRSLTLDDLPKVENLPKGLMHLVYLEHLKIISCPQLKALPEWTSCFKSLQSLHIESCDALEPLPKDTLDLKSLQKLRIHDCPSVGEIDQDQTDLQLSNIQHIPVRRSYFYPYNREAVLTVLVVIAALFLGITGYSANSFYRQLKGSY